MKKSKKQEAPYLPPVDNFTPSDHAKLLEQMVVAEERYQAELASKPDFRSGLSVLALHFIHAVLDMFAVSARDYVIEQVFSGYMIMKRRDAHPAVFLVPFSNIAYVRCK